MKNKDYIKDSIVVGFALFAMFFGAGNLIFPTFLGVESGTSWITGFLGFVLADVGLAILSIMAVAKCNGDISEIFGKAGEKLAIVLGAAIMICLGPLLAIPRTAATTYEMGIAPILNGVSPIVFSIIFFIMTMILSIKPSRVIDIIGQVLTPILIITLLLLILVGIINPIDSVNVAARIENVFAEGVIQGYQTMDALGAVAFASIIITTLINKGYKSEKKKIKLTFQACMVAAIGLVVVYGGLAYLGATIAKGYENIPLKEIVQTSVIVNITDILLGKPGKILLAVIIGLACLTTAIGLTAATAQYFDKVSKGKWKYKEIVIFVCVFSGIVANFGVSSIIKFSLPILSIIYPPTVVLIILSLFRDKIKNNNVYVLSTYTALFVSVVTVLNDMGIGSSIGIPIVTTLPFANLGFNWVVPVLVAGIIGSFVPTTKEL
ncbi:branched-chain amino acid transport system II carrier protein [Clostridium sp. UBA1056]|uniref:branched-chain amino acid transport system II carrier protein n=1 Tax=unclassified Clostridium TaxID=2614128 RepID=UPI0032164FA7